MKELDCSLTNHKFVVSDAEINLINKLSQAYGFLESNLPLPDIEPYQFLRRLNALANLMTLFKSKSALSGKPQISRYNPDLDYKICTQEEFYSDRIDNTEFGLEYNFKESFFSQFDRLMKRVYYPPINATNCEGSDYINGAFNVRNSYLSFVIYNCEDCLYCYNIDHCSDCISCVNSSKSRFCFECNSVYDCYELQYCDHCRNSSNCYFCLDCIGCSDCIYSYGLRNAKYQIANRQVDKDTYLSFIKKLNLASYDGVVAAKNQFKNIIKNADFNPNTLIQVEESTGYSLSQTKNVHMSYYSHNCEDCGYLVLSRNCKDSWRGFSEGGELSYQSGCYKTSYATYNTYVDIGGSYNLYSYILVNSCSNCFGCVGLNKKSYCILNKQYSKNDYYDLVKRIIRHMQSTNEWGKFFPAALSPHYYEYSFSDECHKALEIDNAKNYGYRTGYIDPEINIDLSQQVIPDQIADLDSVSILGQTYYCKITHKPYRIQKKELEFYRKFSIPLPREHWRARIKRNLMSYELPL